ncbi:MAG: hypothetical protein ACKO9D_06000 [Gammaproteobacteria bacterium]
MGRVKASVVGIAAALLLASCSRGPQPLPPESLRIRINILCTTCDDFIACGAPEASRPAAPAPTVIYRLREHGFWAQVATIGDYLVQLFRRKVRDERPLTVYVEDRGQRRVTGDGLRATVDLSIGLLAVPDGSIDLRDGAWRTPTGASRGGCRTMPRREGYAFVRALLGRPLPKAAP